MSRLCWKSDIQKLTFKNGRVAREDYDRKCFELENLQLEYNANRNHSWKGAEWGEGMDEIDKGGVWGKMWIRGVSSLVSELIYRTQDYRPSDKLMSGWMSYWVSGLINEEEIEWGE